MPPALLGVYCNYCLTPSSSYARSVHLGDPDDGREAVSRGEEQRGDWEAGEW